MIEAVELILARCRAEIRKNALAAVQKGPQEEAPKPMLYEHAEVIAIDNWKPEPEACDERARLTRRAQRYDRYQQVMAFYEQGLGFTEITRRVVGSCFISTRGRSWMPGWRKVLPARSANSRAL